MSRAMQDDPGAKIRVLLADDHPVVREGLAAIVARQPDMSVVGSVSSGEEALTLCAAQPPDVVLMDLRMPRMGGVEATRAISERFPNCRVLVLTSFDGDDEIYQALHAGARGYALKDAGGPELVKAIRTVHAGQRWIPAEVADKLAEHVAASELTAREREILTLVAIGNSNKLVARRLGITEGTVKGHINSILTKLAVEDRTEAVTRAVRRGILRLDQVSAQE